MLELISWVFKIRIIALSDKILIRNIFLLIVTSQP